MRSLRDAPYSHICFGAMLLCLGVFGLGVFVGSHRAATPPKSPPSASEALTIPEGAERFVLKREIAVGEALSLDVPGYACAPFFEADQGTVLVLYTKETP